VSGGQIVGVICTNHSGVTEGMTVAVGSLSLAEVVRDAHPIPPIIITIAAATIGRKNPIPE